MSIPSPSPTLAVEPPSGGNVGIKHDLTNRQYDLLVGLIVIGSLIAAGLVIWWCIARFVLTDEAIHNLLPMRSRRRYSTSRKKTKNKVDNAAIIIDPADQDIISTSTTVAASSDDLKKSAIYKNDGYAKETDSLLGKASSQNQLIREKRRRTKYRAGIAACMCVYAENETELTFSHKTFIGEPFMATTLFIMVDVVPSIEEQNDGATFQALKRVWGIDESTLVEEHGCRVYTGVCDKIQIPYYVFVKGPECPRGKRQSHKLFFEVVAQRVRLRQMQKPYGIHMVDGDTGSFEGLADMAKMFAVLVANPGTGAICSTVLPINHSYFNVLLCEQAFEYSNFFRWMSGGMSFFGSVQTAVGMSVLYDYDILLNGIVPDGKEMTLLEKYCAESTSFFDLAMLDLAEDYGITLFLQQAGFDSMICHLSHFRTTCPDTWVDFFGQRRRWNAAYLIGTFHLVFVNSPYFLKYTNARWMIWIVDLVQLLTTFFGAASIVSLWVSYLATGIEYLDKPLNDDRTTAQRLAFICIWTVLLLFFIAVFERSHVDALYILWAFSWFGILFSLYYYVMSFLSGSYTVFYFMAATVVPHFFFNDYRYWLRLASGAIASFIFNQGVTPVALYFFIIANLDSAVWGTRSSTEVSSSANTNYRGTIRLQKIGISVLYITGNILLSYSYVFYHVSEMYILLIIMGWSFLLLPCSMLEWYMQSRIHKYVARGIHHSDYWLEEEDGDDGQQLPQTPWQLLCCCDTVGGSLFNTDTDHSNTADIEDASSSDMDDDDNDHGGVGYGGGYGGGGNTTEKKKDILFLPAGDPEEVESYLRYLA